MKSSKLLLLKEFKRLKKNPMDEFDISLSDSNIYNWNVFFQGPIETSYEEGYFSANINFPENYPSVPPSFVFRNKMFHPNIYNDGKVCLSILHKPIKDKYEYELIEERWRPVLSIESIVLSVISLLSNPNLDSPANLDASVMYRNNFEKYKKKVKKLARQTLE